MNKVLLGRVVKLHGYKGEIKVSTKLDKDFDIKSIKQVYDESENCFNVLRAFKVPDGIVFSLENINLELAKTYIGKNLFISREVVADKILFEDLKASSVYVGEKLVGKVFDVGDYGSAEVIFVKKTDGTELIFPNVAGIIETFNLEQKRLNLNSNKLKEVSDYED